METADNNIFPKAKQTRDVLAEEGDPMDQIKAMQSDNLVSGYSTGERAKCHKTCLFTLHIWLFKQSI